MSPFFFISAFVSCRWLRKLRREEERKRSGVYPPSCTPRPSFLSLSPLLSLPSSLFSLRNHLQETKTNVKKKGKPTSSWSSTTPVRTLLPLSLSLSLSYLSLLYMLVQRREKEKRKNSQRRTQIGGLIQSILYGAPFRCALSLSLSQLSPSLSFEKLGPHTRWWSCGEGGPDSTLFFKSTFLLKKFYLW